jgi:hypothetical protein
VDENIVNYQALHNGRSKCARDVNQKQQSVEDTIKAVLLEDKRQEIREANGQYHLRMSKERTHAARVAAHLQRVLLFLLNPLGRLSGFDFQQASTRRPVKSRK